LCCVGWGGGGGGGGGRLSALDLDWGTSVIFFALNTMRKV